MEVNVLQITESFAPEIPVIVNCPEGIIGRDALTDEFLEVISDYYGYFSNETFMQKSSKILDSNFFYCSRFNGK